MDCCNMTRKFLICVACSRDYCVIQMDKLCIPELPMLGRLSRIGLWNTILVWSLFAIQSLGGLGWNWFCSFLSKRSRWGWETGHWPVGYCKVQPFSTWNHWLRSSGGIGYSSIISTRMIRTSTLEFQLNPRRWWIPCTSVWGGVVINELDGGE